MRLKRLLQRKKQQLENLQPKNQLIRLRKPLQKKKKKAKSSTKTVKSSSKKETSKVTASKQLESNESYSSKDILTEASVSSKATRKTTAASKKASSSKRTAKTSSTKTTKKTTTSRSTTRKKKLSADEITSTTNLTQKIEVIEYYDLPYRYNQTVVRVLAQTPTTLFIYWDISDIDRANFVKQYGEDFFNNTKPVLVIHNNTMHYSFEIEIDDFANSWYLHVNDANCEYTVELGRKPKYYNSEKHVNIQNDYLYVTSSNVIEAPNDHVLFDRNIKNVYFKDVKTNIVTAKDITSISFLRNIGRIYNLYDLQSDFNKNSWIDSNHWQLDLNNPSSSSSTFKQIFMSASLFSAGTFIRFNSCENYRYTYLSTFQLCVCIPFTNQERTN